MLKRIILLGLLITVFGTANSIAQFAGGSGTEEDPYQISTVEQLQEIKYYLSSNFILINDIDASITSTWNDSTGFETIGDSDFNFTGSLDGGNYTIDSLFIKRGISSETNYYAGLFRVIVGATIRNLNISNIRVSGSSYVGGVVGTMHSSKISNVTLSGVIKAESYIVGAIAGRISTNSLIENVEVNAEVDGVNEVGGIVGENRSGSLINVHMNGHVKGISTIGGLVGINGLTNYGSDNAVIKNSSSSATVIVDSASFGNITGGLVGLNNRFGVIDSSSSSSEIYAFSQVGGLAGTNSGEIYNSMYNGILNAESSEIGGIAGLNSGYGVIESSKSLSTINGINYVGGLVGTNTSIIRKSYSKSIVTGIDKVGGIVGYNYTEDSSIHDVYALGQVAGNTEVGGAIGVNAEFIEISNAFISVSVEGEEDFGAFAGVNSGSISGSYWNEDSSSVNRPVGRGYYDGINRLNTNEMTGTSASQNMVEFDFTNIWKVTEEFPALQWEEVEGIPTSIEKSEAINDYRLLQNYPNPFNPTTQIRYGIPQAAEVELTIFNMLGQKVVTLVNQKQSAGWHTATFDASGLSSGFYIYRIQAGEFVSTKKLMLIK
ncbi:T9SS type A sorting domain-containing protein [Gracilimonas halophila]|uniref:T9SS type A sorting domain-containing protein n=2 Tax=Gracilimonas halophila TaxID=1834464 RepID=A0ABW5JHQ7_9BACT